MWKYVDCGLSDDGDGDMINITKIIERLTPTSSMGYGVKVTFVFTSFNKQEIDAVERQMNTVVLNCTEKEEEKV